jgi:hypothetical protein
MNVQKFKDLAVGAKYSGSIVEVALVISRSLSGTGDPLPDDCMRRAIEWLSWRIHQDGGWDKSETSESHQIENAVRVLVYGAIITAVGRDPKLLNSVWSRDSLESAHGMFISKLEELERVALWLKSYADSSQDSGCSEGARSLRDAAYMLEGIVSDLGKV